jgi:hypothetical protein
MQNPMLQASEALIRPIHGTLSSSVAVLAELVKPNLSELLTSQVLFK